jgi:hypothetical protein
MADSPPATEETRPVFVRSQGATRTELLRQQIGPVRHLPDSSAAPYHDGEQYISWLNYTLGEEGWSFRILEQGRDEDGDEMWCLGELTVVIWDHDPNDEGFIRHTVVKQDFGAQQIKRLRSNGLPKSIGDDRKAAATDALKRCARLLGIGLYLWEKGDPADTPYRRSEEEEAFRANRGSRNGPAGNAPRAGAGPRANGRANAPQGAGQAPNGAPRPSTPAPAPVASGPEHEAAVERYRDLIQQAIDLDFSAGWADQDPTRLTEPQLRGYCGTLQKYVEGAQRRSGAA